MTEQEELEKFLEDNRGVEPWDYVKEQKVIKADGHIVAVIDAMDCGDAIVTLGE